MKKTQIPNYSDGFITVYKGKTKKSDFNAVKNDTSTSDLEKIIRLPYTEMSMRAEDIDFASSNDRTLNMKVKTPLRFEAKQNHFVVLGKMLYSIINLDYDRHKKEMFFYLEEVRQIAE